MWASEKDGWRHLYRVSRDGKKETLITVGNYDVMKICCIDEKGGYVYFMASPENATQEYLYRTKLDGKGKSRNCYRPPTSREHMTYDVSPMAQNLPFILFPIIIRPIHQEWISLPDHKALNGQEKYQCRQ